MEILFTVVRVQFVRVADFVYFYSTVSAARQKKSSMAIAFRTQRMKDEECLLVGVLVCMHEYTFALSFRGKNWNTY